MAALPIKVIVIPFVIIIVIVPIIVIVIIVVILMTVIIEGAVRVVAAFPNITLEAISVIVITDGCAGTSFYLGEKGEEAEVEKPEKKA